MQTLKRAGAALIASALLLTGCGAGSADSAAAARPGPAPQQPARILAVSPTAYVATAASIHLFAIRSAELALQRGGSSQQRQLAQILLQDHRGASAQLSFAGRRLNLIPRATMLPYHDAMLQELASSPDFAATFRRLQLRVHEEEQRLHASFATSGSSPTLRPVAHNAANLARKHLALLRAR